MEILQSELTAISNIVAVLESPHTSYHADGQAMKNMLEAKVMVQRLQAKLFKYMNEKKSSDMTASTPKPLDTEHKEEKPKKKGKK